MIGWGNPFLSPGSDGPDLCKPHHLPILIDPIQTLPMKLNKTKSGDPDNHISFCLFWQEEVQLEKLCLSLSLGITVIAAMIIEFTIISKNQLFMSCRNLYIIWLLNPKNLC